MTGDGSRRVVLVCGPPGAGKTTWARASGLTVYDLDDPQWRGEHHFRHHIARLAVDPHAQAAVIRTGATRQARAIAARMIGATETLILDVPADIAKQRVRARAPRPGSPTAELLQVVDTWWARYEPPTDTPPEAPSHKTTEW